MPLLTALFLAYAGGLWLALGGRVAVGMVGTVIIGLAALAQRSTAAGLSALAAGLALATGVEARATDQRCRREYLQSGAPTLRLLEPLRPTRSAAALTTGRCRLRVRVSARQSEAAGTELRVEGTVRRAGGALAIRATAVAVVSPPGPIARSRTGAGDRIDRVFGRDAPLVRALVLAEQFDLDRDLRERWADAGIIHMVSVSGLHVSIIAGALVAFFAGVGFPRLQGEAAAVFLLAAYIAWIGAPPPAVRSATMTAWTLMSRWQQRPPSIWAVWAAGSGLSLLEPRVVNDIGWQLSVSGMAGLVAAGRFTSGLSFRSPWVRHLTEGVVATGVATIVSAPIVAWTFGRISLASLATNLAAAPLFNIAQPLLFVAVGLAWLPDAVNGIVVDAARGALWMIDLVAAAGARVPLAVLAVAPDALTAMSLAVVAVGLVLSGAMRNWRPGITVALAALVVGAWGRWLPRGNGRLELHVLDVGQGDALALRSPRGRWILVDAGPAWDGGDAGRRTVAPHLRRYGGDVVHQVITHPHLDHYGGVPGLLEPLAVDSIWEGGAGANATYRTWQAAERRPWQVLQAGDSLVLDGVTVQVLSPSAAWRAQQDNPNESSVVLRVVYGAQRWLLMGDAEAGAEEWLLAQAPDVLAATVLKVGHHGSRTSSSPAFLDRVRPRVAVISVGRDNDYGHPSDDVLQRLDALGVHVLRTDDDGTMILSTDGTSLEARTEWSRWRYSGTSQPR